MILNLARPHLVEQTLRHENSSLQRKRSQFNSELCTRDSSLSETQISSTLNSIFKLLHCDSNATE